MTPDKELADACVRVGIGVKQLTEVGLLYLIDDQHMGESNFVTDWRVAGACMEKCLYEGYEIRLLRNIDEWSVAVLNFADVVGRSEGSADAPAIIEACLRAMGELDG